jgi:hypothetical protein
VKVFSLCLRFHVLTAASMKIIAFWDIVRCSLVEADRCFRWMITYRPDNGGSTYLCGVVLFQRDYTVLHPRNLS